MSSRNDDLKYNASGYIDPTAYTAIMTIEEEEMRKKRLIRTIKYICELAGFQIESRIVLRNIKTGRYWR